MKNYINLISVILLFSFLSLNGFKNYSNKIVNTRDEIKIYVCYENITTYKKQKTNLKLIIKRKNLEVIDLGIFDGAFSVEKNQNQENILQNFTINSAGITNNFKILRKNDSIILLRTIQEIALNKIDKTILKTIFIGDAQVKILNPVEVKENPKAL